MKKKFTISIFTIIVLSFVIFLSYKVYLNSMESVLFTIDKVVLQIDESKETKVEIKVDSEVENIFMNAEYAGKFVVSKGKQYHGFCYYKDGIIGTILISQDFGAITISAGDDYTRCFIFKNGFDKVWLDYIKTKISSNLNK